MRVAHLKYFAMAIDADGDQAHLSGPYNSSDDAHAALAEDLQASVDSGNEIVTAGVFTADFEATPIPSKTVKEEGK